MKADCNLMAFEVRQCLDVSVAGFWTIQKNLPRQHQYYDKTKSSPCIHFSKTLVPCNWTDLSNPPLADNKNLSEHAIYFTPIFDKEPFSDLLVNGGDKGNHIDVYPLKKQQSASSQPPHSSIFFPKTVMQWLEWPVAISLGDMRTYTSQPGDHTSLLTLSVYSAHRW